MEIEQPHIVFLALYTRYQQYALLISGPFHRKEHNKQSCIAWQPSQNVWNIAYYLKIFLDIWSINHSLIKLLDEASNFNQKESIYLLMLSFFITNWNNTYIFILIINISLHIYFYTYFILCIYVSIIVSNF